MRYGIGLKLGLLLTSFSLVAMGIVGYYSYASGRATLLAAAQRDLLTAPRSWGATFRPTSTASPGTPCCSPTCRPAV